MRFVLWSACFLESTLSVVSLLLSHSRTSKVPHKWPCKNGNLLRSGISPVAAPRDLEKPIWEWEVPGHNRTHGHVETTPLIDNNDNIFIGTTTGSIVALRRDGTELWQHTETPERLNFLPHVLTGALYGDSLYVPTSDGVALSLDLATGKLNWRKKYAPIAGCDAWSATATDGLIVLAGSSVSPFGGNEYVGALSAKDGSQKWLYKPRSNVFNFMPAVHDGKLIFMDLKGDMYCLKLADGTQLWTTTHDASGSDSRFTTAGLSIGPNGLAYTMFNTKGDALHGTGSGGVLKAYDVDTGKERWSKSFEHEALAAPVVGRLGPNGPTAVVAGMGHNVGLYAPIPRESQGFIKAFEADTGAELWTFTTPSKMLNGAAGIYSTPDEDSIPDGFSNAAIGKDGTLYVGWQGGKQYALDGPSGKLISEHFNGFGQQGEPAISDDLVIFPSIGKVLAFSK
jgi:outer membrane protein assembly factor BamB